MRISLVLVVLVATALAFGNSAHAKGGSHSVKGYTKKNGTHVAPHHQTNPNDTKRDNYSSKGNANPHRGKPGTKDPDKHK